MRVIRPGRLESPGDLYRVVCPKCNAEVEARVDEFVFYSGANDYLRQTSFVACPTARCGAQLWRMHGRLKKREGE